MGLRPSASSHGRLLSGRLLWACSLEEGTPDAVKQNHSRRISMSNKARESEASDSVADASNPPTPPNATQPETDVESTSGSARATRGESNSSVDAPNARDDSVLPDEVVRSNDRTIARASDLDSSGSLDAPDDMRDMTA